MNKWILNPTEIDFGAGTATPLLWGLGFPYRVENTAYDHNGNVLFHIQDLNVYYADGTMAGNLPQGYDPVSGYNYWSVINEISIVPVPGSCDKYYVIYCLNRGFVGNALKYATVTVNPNGTVSISTDTKLIGANAGNIGALAVTQVIDGGRRLYWVSGYGGVFEYRITAADISLHHVEVGYGSNPNLTFHAIEAEVSSDGRNLIWVEQDGAYFRRIASPEGAVILDLNDHSMWGIEFDAAETGFYVSTEKDLGGATGTVGGIYHFPDFLTTSSPTLVSNTLDYTRTLIERAIDGDFYAVNRFGVLGSYVGNGPASAAFNGLVVNSSVPALYLGPNDHYKLPDQIDGEDYSYFYGVDPVNLTGMDINGTPLADAVPPPPPAFYDCNPINWSVAYTGLPASWNIMIFSVDPATGNQLFGPPYLNYSFSGTGPIPTPIDLSGLGPNLFAYYLGQTFAIKVTIVNACGTSSDFMRCYFRVLGAPAPANINLQINPGNGNPCPASHNIASPCPASIYSASVNMGNSQGDITYYSLKIDAVDCSTGNIMANIYTGPQVSVSGTNQLTALGLNDLQINGSTGYFVDKCCRCYRVEATIGNECGSSTDYSYIKFTVNCNCLWEGEEEEQAKQAPGQGNGAGVQVAPNPVADQLRFLPDASGLLPSVASLTIFNALGGVALRLDRPDLAEPVRVGQLPAGTYYYLLETETGTLPGKFVKQ